MYQVREIGRYGDWVAALTEIQNGHTKGHRHPETENEIYLWVGGSGKILLKREDELREIPLTREDPIVYIEGGWAHRAVQTGEETFSFLSIYKAGTHKDYDVDFE